MINQYNSTFTLLFLQNLHTCFIISSSSSIVETQNLRELTTKRVIIISKKPNFETESMTPRMLNWDISIFMKKPNDPDEKK